MKANERLPWREGATGPPSMSNTRARTRGAAAAKAKALAPHSDPDQAKAQAKQGLAPQTAGDSAARRASGEPALHEEDGDSASCRTDSAYILLQLRDMGRASLTRDRVVDSKAASSVSVDASTPVGTEVPSGPTSGAEVAAEGKSINTVIKGNSTASAVVVPVAAPSVAGGDQLGYQNQVQNERRMLPTSGSSHRFGFGPACSPSSSSVFGSGATAGVMGMGAAAAAAAAAVERSMYVTGLLPGFPGRSSPSTAASAAAVAAAAAASSHLPPHMLRPTTSAPGTGGSAALRPICPKRTPDDIMVVSPMTGQLVPVGG